MSRMDGVVMSGSRYVRQVNRRLCFNKIIRPGVADGFCSCLSQAKNDYCTEGSNLNSSAPIKLIFIGLSLLLICAMAAYFKGGTVEYVANVFTFKEIDLMSINIPVGYYVVGVGAFRLLGEQKS